MPGTVGGREGEGKAPPHTAHAKALGWKYWAVRKAEKGLGG